MPIYNGISLNGFAKSKSLNVARAKAYAWAKREIFDCKYNCAGTQAITQVTKVNEHWHYDNVGTVEFRGNKDNWKIVWEVQDKANAKLPISKWMVTRYDLSPNGAISNPRRKRFTD